MGDMMWFKAQLIWGAALEGMKDEEIARFTKALWRFAQSGEVEKVEGYAGVLYRMATAQLVMDSNDHALYAERMKANGKRGGRPRNAARAEADRATAEQARADEEDNAAEEPQRSERESRTAESYVPEDNGARICNAAEGSEPARTDTVMILKENEPANANTAAENQRVLNGSTENQLVFNKSNAREENLKDKEKETDKETERDREKEIVVVDKPFIPPERKAIEDYIREKGFSFSAEAFHDYYAAKGWRLGNTPMEDWRAVCRSWERKEMLNRGNNNDKGRTNHKYGDLSTRV